VEYLEYGYLGLFVATMLAATIFPLYSEAILSVMIIADYNVVATVIVASFGNTAGGMISYYMGYFGNWAWIEKYLKVQKSFVDRYQPQIDKYGSISALMCWAPFIGDPLAIVLGFLRTNTLKVSIFMFIGKLIRYIVLGYLTLWGMEIY